MKRITNGNHRPIYYQFNQWLNAPIRHGVFTRHGGVSNGHFDSLNVGGMIGDDQQNVSENCRRAYSEMGLHEQQVCTVWQVHGADAVFVRHPYLQRKWMARADGMLTQQPGVGLAMRFADCVPILFYDPAHHAIGIAHAGWRGTVAGTALSVFEAMQVAFQTHSADVQVAIGPSIGPQRYQVGEEVVDAVHERFGSIDDLITRADDGTAYLNLWEANRRLLATAGIDAIEVAGLCTAENTDEFFSHRAENGKTGRFSAVIALNAL